MLYGVLAGAVVLILVGGFFLWSRRSVQVERLREVKRAERQRRRVVEWEQVEKEHGGRHPDMRLTMDRDAPPGTGGAPEEG